MLATIMRFEWRMLVADRTAQIVIVLLVLMNGYAVTSGFLAYRAQEEIADKIRFEEKAKYEKLLKDVTENESQVPPGEDVDGAARFGVRHPIRVHFGSTNFRAALPPSDNSVMSGGESGLYPQIYRYYAFEDEFLPSLPTVGNRSLSGLRPERPTDNPQGQTLGDFDLSFAVIYLYPLVILTLGFNLVPTEKESGTLSLVLAQPVRFRTLLLGKIAVRALLIFAFGILLPAVLMLVGWLVGGAEINFVLLVVWMLATSLYCVLWFALAAVINARGRTAAANALALAVCWLVLVALVPAVAGIVVETLAPVPSPVEFADAEREARLAATLLIDAPRDEVRDAREKRYRADYNDKAGQERRTRGIYEEPMELPNDRRLLVEFFSQHPQISPTQTTLQLLYIFSEIRNERIEAGIAPLLEKTTAGRERRESYAQISRFFSPSILLQNIFQNIADAGDSRQRRFLAQLDDHIRGLNNRLKEKILRNQSVTATDVKNLAPFQYREAATGEILERSAISLLMLIVLSALASFLAFNAFRNRSVAD